MKNIDEALLHIKSKHNGEIPYKYGSYECAMLMQSYAEEYLKNSLRNCDESAVEEEYDIQHLINNTYQVVGKETNTVWFQGSLEECNDWVML